MKKDWTDVEVYRLLYLVENNGRANGIHMFAYESGRSENSVRIKLYRINKKQNIQIPKENDIDYQKLDKGELDKQDENLSFFERVTNAFKRLFE